jgi:hypothetical protein
MCRRLLPIVVSIVAFGLAGCDSSPTSLVAPSPGPQPAPAPQSTEIQVIGMVLDTALRPLAGATVDVVDGHHAGTSTIADAFGEFRFRGTFDDTTTFRASKDGYIGAIGTLSRSCASCDPASRWIAFYLAVPAAPVEIAGDYTLTFTADSACADLPIELRRRTYAATISPQSPPNAPANTMFAVRVSGAQFFSDHSGFFIGVAGNFIALEFGGHGPYVVEQVAPNTYLGFDGRAGTSVGTSPVSTISTSFDGSIEYCERKSAMGVGYSCRPDEAVALARCVSKNHQLILTRR